jgi:hypothetical protein
MKDLNRSIHLYEQGLELHTLNCLCFMNNFPLKCWRENQYIQFDDIEEYFLKDV